MPRPLRTFSQQGLNFARRAGWLKMRWARSNAAIVHRVLPQVIRYRKDWPVAPMALCFYRQSPRIRP